MTDKELRLLAQPLLGKWTLFILYELEDGPKHFAELERRIEGISRKVLAENLQELCQSGFLEKQGEPSTGHKVYYSLTDLAQSLFPILLEIKQWLKKHAKDIQKNRMKP